MPTPTTYEKKGDFIKRCIPIVIKDGTAADNKQAVAVCESIWKKSKLQMFIEKMRRMLGRAK